MSAALFLEALVRLSAQAGALVVLVLLVQWLFRKQLTPRWRCALWFLVIARLVLPLAPGSAASVFTLVPAWRMSLSSPPSAPVVQEVPAAAVAGPSPAAPELAAVSPPSEAENIGTVEAGTSPAEQLEVISEPQAMTGSQT